MVPFLQNRTFFTDFLQKNEKKLQKKLKKNAKNDPFLRGQNEILGLIVVIDQKNIVKVVVSCGFI